MASRQVLIDIPSLCRSILACHKDTTVIADTFRLVHSGEESSVNRYIAGDYGVDLILREGEAFQECCYNALSSSNVLPISPCVRTSCIPTERRLSSVHADYRHDPAGIGKPHSCLGAVSGLRHNAVA